MKNNLTTSLDNIWVLIPSYQPQPVLVGLVDNLFLSGVKHVILVDDGSTDKTLFNTINNSHPDINLVSYQNNKGKGGALKEGLKLFLEEAHDDAVIVTMDADGQHTVEDALRVAKAHKEHQYTLGARDFDKDIPFRSKFGNKVTRWVTRFSKGINLSDTQTGLRGISPNLARQFLEITLDGYDFEFECLIVAKELDCQFIEVPIKTIYIDHNASSHFNPIVDSFKIYFVFIKHLISSLSSFLLDLLLFYVFYKSGLGIFIATILARILSATFNFLVSKYIVFDKKHKSTFVKEALSYAALALLVANISGLLVEYFSGFDLLPVLLIKIIVDGVLFVINYLILKRIIFKKH